MNTLLIATHNHAKIKELKFGFRNFKKTGLKILTLADLKIKDKPDENGKTFKENAGIKAEFYADLTNLPAIADDGGLIIPYLNNEPGVKSRRWLGYEASDDELINHTLSHLRGGIRANRTAYLETCICFYNPMTKKTVYEQEKIRGLIADKPYRHWERGYPYRALFIVEKLNKYYDELTEKEHLQINHRLKAVRKLIAKIELMI